MIPVIIITIIIIRIILIKVKGECMRVQHGGGATQKRESRITSRSMTSRRQKYQAQYLEVARKISNKSNICGGNIKI